MEVWREVWRCGGVEVWREMCVEKGRKVCVERGMTSNFIVLLFYCITHTTLCGIICYVMEPSAVRVRARDIDFLIACVCDCVCEFLYL